MEHPNKNVKLAVASCLSEITWITTLMAACNDDVVRKILQLTVKSFQGLHDDRDPTFAKMVKILDIMQRSDSFPL